MNIDHHNMDNQNSNNIKTPDSEPSMPDNFSKIVFHIILGGFLFSFILLPVFWYLAVKNYIKDGDDENKKWSLRNIYLLTFDTILIASFLIAFIVNPSGFFEKNNTQELNNNNSPRIGVYINKENIAKGIKIYQVLPHSPAEKAGLKSGDIIESVENTPVKNYKSLMKHIKDTQKNEKLQFNIKRNSKKITVSIIPEVEPLKKQGLFDPLNEIYLNESIDEEINISKLSISEYIPWIVIVVVIVFIWIFGKIYHKNMNSVWRWYLIILLSSGLVSSGFIYCIQKITGYWSAGVLFISLWIQNFIMLGLSIFIIRYLNKKDSFFSFIEPKFSTINTVFLGIFYMIFGILRVAIFIMVINIFIPLDSLQGVDNPLELFGIDDLNFYGLLLFMIPAVILAPISEELVFRGIVLPRLSLWMNPTKALIISSLFFSILHIYYGIHILIVLFYGIILGWARLRTGNLKASIILHALINSLASLGIIFN